MIVLSYQMQTDSKFSKVKLNLLIESKYEACTGLIDLFVAIASCHFYTEMHSSKPRNSNLIMDKNSYEKYSSLIHLLWLIVQTSGYAELFFQ